MGTICITGSASGMGAATAARLRAKGHTVIGVDVRDADIVADLGTPEGRTAAIAAVTEACGGALDGLAPFAGLGPLPGRSGALIASVNYFGTVALLEGLHPCLARGTDASAVAISSNSTTCQPGYPLDLVDALLAGDEARARTLAEETGPFNSYPASKLAVARFVRRNAPTPEWTGRGIRLNAIAPGKIATNMIAEGMADPDMRPLLEAFTVPIGRDGRPEELAALVDFLLGPDSTFFCGSIVFCDGGTEAQLRPDDWPSPWDLDGF